MAVSEVPLVRVTTRHRKTYFPFEFGLRSQEFQGVGASLAENVYIQDGRLNKLKGQNTFTNLTAGADVVSSIIWQGRDGFENTDGTYQILNAFAVGSVYSLRSVEVDDQTIIAPVLAEANEIALTGTFTFTNGSAAVTATSGLFTTELVVGDYIYLDGEYANRAIVKTITDATNIVLQAVYGGTGGAGNGKLASVHFTSSNFDMVQLGAYAYITNESATTPMYSYDGVTLKPITNAPASPKYVLKDGNRLSINKVFSGAITGELTNFTAGAGAAASGDYATDINTVAGIEAGSGIIVMGQIGANALKVIPNNASDDVSAKNKLDGFSYTGLGVKNTHQITAAKEFVYFFNSEGIHEMNPFDGSTTNLAKSGAIKRRWDKLNITDAFIVYDSENDRVLVIVKSRGQNDTAVVVDTGLAKRPITFSPSAFFSSMSSVNNQLYGGSSHDGKVIEMFTTFTDRDATALQFRYIIEWDALTNAMLEKRLKRFSIFANLNPQSSFTVNLYKDGNHAPIFTQAFTTAASVDSGSIGSTLGEMNKYVFNLGGGRDGAQLDLNTDKMKRNKENAKVSTYCLEILENSFYEFKVYDILLEYKTKGRIVPSLTMANTLF